MTACDNILLTPGELKPTRTVFRVTRKCACTIRPPWVASSNRLRRNRGSQIAPLQSSRARKAPRLGGRSAMWVDTAACRKAMAVLAVIRYAVPR